MNRWRARDRRRRAGHALGEWVARSGRVSGWAGSKPKGIGERRSDVVVVLVLATESVDRYQTSSLSQSSALAANRQGSRRRTRSLNSPADWIRFVTRV
jgi:hypothetical protein